MNSASEHASSGSSAHLLLLLLLLKTNPTSAAAASAAGAADTFVIMSGAADICRRGRSASGHKTVATDRPTNPRAARPPGHRRQLIT